MEDYEKKPKFKVGDTIRHKAHGDKYRYTIHGILQDAYVLDDDLVLTFNMEDSWEIVESKDERIRKAIGYAIVQSTHSDGTLINGVSSEEALAWLEKQGEQKSAEPTDLRTWKYIVDAVLTEREGIGNYLDNPWTTEVAEKLQKRYGNIEQKTVDVRFPHYDNIVCKVFGAGNLESWEYDEAKALVRLAKEELLKDLQSEQNLVDSDNILKCGDIVVDKHNRVFFVLANVAERNYKEEYSTYCESLLLGVDGCVYANNTDLVGFKRVDNEERTKFLHDLKIGTKLMRNPVEWSEEDEQFLLVCKNALAKYQVSDKWDAGIISRWLENRLKSLRPQNRWKPSEEQMEVVLKCADWLKGCDNKDDVVLRNLYNNLKAL